MKEALIEGFHYDLWANTLWLDYLKDRGFEEPDTSIFCHILAAQEVWSRRLEGVSLTAMPVMQASPEVLAEINVRWLNLLEILPADKVIDYRNTSGQAFSLQVKQIASHVIDHGTYHRGELRGLCRARESVDFPESGLVGFYLSNQAS